MSDEIICSAFAGFVNGKGVLLNVAFDDPFAASSVREIGSGSIRP